MAWATALVSFENGVVGSRFCGPFPEVDLTVQMTAVHCTVWQLVAHAAADGFTNRFEIIPQDGPRWPCARAFGETTDGEPFLRGCGTGFDPGSTPTLQMFDRTARLQISRVSTIREDMRGVAK